MLINEKWIKKKGFLKPSAKGNFKKPARKLNNQTNSNDRIIPSVSPVVYPYKKRFLKTNGSKG